MQVSAILQYIEISEFSAENFRILFCSFLYFTSLPGLVPVFSMRSSYRYYLQSNQMSTSPAYTVPFESGRLPCCFDLHAMMLVVVCGGKKLKPGEWVVRAKSPACNNNSFEILGGPKVTEVCWGNECGSRKLEPVFLFVSHFLFTLLQINQSSVKVTTGSICHRCCSIPVTSVKK